LHPFVDDAVVDDAGNKWRYSLFKRITLYTLPGDAEKVAIEEE
jgi:hypothetical protein